MKKLLIIFLGVTLATGCASRSMGDGPGLFLVDLMTPMVNDIITASVAAGFYMKNQRWPETGVELKEFYLKEASEHGALKETDESQDLDQKIPIGIDWAALESSTFTIIDDGTLRIESRHKSPQKPVIKEGLFNKPTVLPITIDESSFIAEIVVLNDIKTMNIKKTPVVLPEG